MYRQQTFQVVENFDWLTGVTSAELKADTWPV